MKAIYTSETSFTTIIEKVPLTLEFDLPSKIESSKELRFKLNYFSNTNFPLSDLRITIDYPSNFEFIESSPAAMEKTEWDVGLLNKAEGGRVEILGRVFGEVGEEKVFQAKIGSWQDNEFVLLKEVARGVTIINPALYITQQINGSPEFIASPGDALHYEIFFKNIGEETLNDLSLLVTLTGPSFDFQTIKAPEGDFETGDNSIIWDWRRVGDLQLLPSQEEGKVDFWIDMEEEWPIETLDDKNPEIKTKVYLSQNREEFINKVNSKLGIAQQGFFQDEVFDNSGPIPPKIGESTTYTIMWQLQNFYNEVKDATVKAVLPKNVKLTGEIFPEEQEEKFTFDSASRELVWKVGDLLAAQGILNPAPNLSFQVSFTPDSSQKGKTPNLIEEATITGEDQWTKETLSATSSAINTTLPDDDTVSATQGKVQ